MLSDTWVWPTSITIAPSLTISAVTNSVLPMATIRMPALAHSFLRFFVLLCARVTVALPGLGYATSALQAC